MIEILSADEENRAEKVEAEKQDQLAKQKQGKGEWKDGLASDSESIVCIPLDTRVWKD